MRTPWAPLDDRPPVPMAKPPTRPATQDGPTLQTRNVVYLDHTAKPSGGELALLRLLSFLPATQAHVILGEEGPLAEQLQAAHISMEVFPLSARVGDVRKDEVGAVSASAVVSTCVHTVRLARRLRRMKPDLVHTNSLKSALYGGVAARLAGLPVVWHIRDRIASDYLPSRVVRVVRLASVLIPDAVIVDSQTVRRTLPSGARVMQIPSPVPDVGVVRRPEEPGRPLRIALVGRLAPWKGQDLFLDAFQEAFGDGDEEAVLVGGALFGEADYERQLRERVASGFGGRVTMTGHLDDITPQLADADILVHAARIPEPFGLIVLEAMSAGVPVVGPDAGGPAELITDGVNGLLYPAGSATGLAERLVALRDDPVLRGRLSEGGKELAAGYRPEVLAPLVDAAYDDILGAPTGVSALFTRVQEVGRHQLRRRKPGG